MHCESCGMPMQKQTDFGGRNRKNRYCAYCSDAQGALKPREAVREQMVSLFLRQRGGDRLTAERSIDAYMRRMPAWRVAASANRPSAA
ncbi:MAG: zinc ribbon domain-containing protein [Candidatus Sumerlaeota bacterium]|nr:zinc ribbon domain-containing protein [Candidatus Sumerlaeota bacterium]